MKFTAFVLATAAASVAAQTTATQATQVNPFAMQPVQTQFNQVQQQQAYQPYMVQQPTAQTQVLQQPIQYQLQQPIVQNVDPLAWERDCTWINSVNFRALLSMATCGAYDCGATTSIGPNGNGGGHARSADGGTHGYHVWSSVVNRAGRVCAVAYTGADLTQQFPYGRVLSMKLANTANSLSLPTRAAPSHIRHSYPNNNRGLIMSGSGNAQYAVSSTEGRLNSDGELDENDFAQFKVTSSIAAEDTGNNPNTVNSRYLASPPISGAGRGYFAESQWFGFTLPAEQFNPGNIDVHYQGATSNYGEACGTTRQDSMCMQKPGGFTYQAGGLPLYDAQGVLRGAIGVSGDNDCTNHAIAWKAREQLNLQYTPCASASNIAGSDDIRNDNLISGNSASVTTSIQNKNVLWAGSKAEDNVIFSEREQYLFPGCQNVIRQFHTTNPTMVSTFSTTCTK